MLCLVRARSNDLHIALLAGSLSVLGLLSFANSARAVVPINDEITNAMVVTTLPFTNVVDVSEATVNGDPQLCNNVAATVWYRFTPAEDMTIIASSWSGWYTSLAAFTGTPENLTSIRCGNSVTFSFRVLSNSTYYFQAGAGPSCPCGTDITFSLTRPVNEIPYHDDFTNVIVIGEVPYRHSVNISGTTESGEPICVRNQQTVWYAFTPTQNMTLFASGAGGDFDPQIGIYTGPPGNLTRLACQLAPAYLDAISNQTYYFQVGKDADGGGYNLVFSLQPPQDITSIYVAKANVYLQKQAGSRGSLLRSVFGAGVELGFGGQISFVDLRWPPDRTQRFRFNFPNEFPYSAEFRRPVQMEREFPAGDYVFTIGAKHSGTNDFTLPLPAPDFPNVPFANNWKAAQRLNALSPFTVVWDTFLAATTNDQIQVDIVDPEQFETVFQSPTIGTSNALNGLATSLVVPAGTLLSGREYLGIVTFARHVYIAREVVPGASAMSSFASSTGFRIRTLASSSSGPIQLAFSGPRYTVSERNGTATITVMRTGNTAGHATVDFATVGGDATPGEDYQPFTGTLIFPSGETTRTFAVPIYDDGTLEEPETVGLQLTNPVGARLALARARINIVE